MNRYPVAHPHMPLPERQSIARAEARRYLRKDFTIRSIDVNGVTYVLERPRRFANPWLMFNRRVDTVVVSVNAYGKVITS